MHVDQTGLPTAFSKKITLGEPSSNQSAMGWKSIDSLFECADRALEQEGVKIWILLDRLDTVFQNDRKKEKTCLRSLFRAYKDLFGYEQICVKVFLRSDIWRIISEGGFREASHITDVVELDWDQNEIADLIARRLLANECVRQHYDFDQQQLEDWESKLNFIRRALPQHVGRGQSRSQPTAWIMENLADGSGSVAPRDVIRFLHHLKAEEIKRLKRGESDVDGEELFSAHVFRKALDKVSRERIEKTLFAEYYEMKKFVEKLEGGSPRRSSDDLVRAWNVSKPSAVAVGKSLSEIGFFKRPKAVNVNRSKSRAERFEHSGIEKPRKAVQDDDLWFEVSPIYRPYLRLEEKRRRDAPS